MRWAYDKSTTFRPRCLTLEHQRLKERSLQKQFAIFVLTFALCAASCKVRTRTLNVAHQALACSLIVPWLFCFVPLRRWHVMAAAYPAGQLAPGVTLAVECFVEVSTDLHSNDDALFE